MNPLFRKLGLYAAAGLLLLMFTGCLNDSAEPEIDLNATPPPDEAFTVPTSTAEPELTPTPPVPTWLPPLLEPGPPALVSAGIYFQNGPDAWLVGGDLAVRQVTERRRVRAVATIPGSMSASILLIETTGGREAEEIRIIDSEGEESEPIYGPEITGDPGGNPRVTLLQWSPDGQVLAIVRDDDSVLLARPGEGDTQLNIPEPTPNIEAIRWSPDGRALAILYRPQGNAGELRIVPIDASGLLDIAPERSFGTVDWLPASGNLVVSEDRGAGDNPNAGSLFTLEANGSNRELLISAGEFGPAVRIGEIKPSPDGSQLAFTIETPNESGEFRFQALFVHEIATGIRRELDISPGHAVSDLWWFEGGLAGRVLFTTEGASGSGAYSGIEAFAMLVFDRESGEGTLVYSSDGV